MKQLLLWQNQPASNAAAANDDSLVASDVPCANCASPTLEELALPAEVPVTDGPETDHEPNGPPIAMPLPTALAAGAFGWTTDGAIAPDHEEIAALTAEHVHEMIVVLSDYHAVEDALRFGYDPATTRSPATADKREALQQSLQKERQRLIESYTDATNSYAESFGDEAAEDLDRWVRTTVANGDPQKRPYPPSHPWHYYHAGDNAPPMPVDQIPPDEDAGHYLESSLPKNPAKRLAKLREWLAREQEQLEADRIRYADIVERGAEALSRYDREIAYTSDAMARAGALSLKYRHVSVALGRLRWIEDQLKKLGAGELFAPT